MQTIQIGDRRIGEHHPTYVIAEIGINHNGDEGLAMRLIEAAAEAGADAVKFQKRHLPSLYRQDVLDHPERYEQHFQYIIPLLKEVELPEELFPRLMARCRELGLEFLCTPFDPVSAAFLAELGVNAFKIASADLSNLDLLDRVAAYGRPMLLSTGMSHWQEIEQAVAVVQRRGVPFALLHCRSVYPVWPRDVNLKMISRLQRFGCPVGYSGHELGIVIPLAAASMGAAIVEKHLTLDRDMRGPDHKVSLLPFEFKRMVRDIRVADQAVGKSKRFLLRGEIINRELFAKSLVAACDLSPGTVIRREHVLVRGPGKGLAPNRLDELLGTRLRRFVRRHDYFVEEDVTDAEVPFLPHKELAGEWGLIARFADAAAFLAHKPRVIEFHLAERDFGLDHGLDQQRYPCALVVHAPEYMGDHLNDLASSREELRRRSVDQAIRAARLALDELAFRFSGRPKLIVHPGAMSLNTKLDHDLLLANLARSLDELRLAIGDAIELLFENLPPYPWYFGGQWKGNAFMAADEIDAFCRRHGIGLCFDLSHAALYCNAKEADLVDFVTTVLPHTRHVHFADAYGLDGEGVQIGEGDIDFSRIMPLFAGYRHSWVPEIWRGHLDGGRGFLLALERLAGLGMGKKGLDRTVGSADRIN